MTIHDELLRKENERILKQLRELDAYIQEKTNDHRRKTNT
jgi:hypothetical protein